MDIEVLSDFIEEVLQKPSVTIIAADQSKSSAAKPYATVKVSTDKESGFPISEIESVSESEANQLMSTWNVASVELQLYSNDITGEFSSQNLAKFFITALGFQRSKIFQRDNGFGVLNVRPRINADIALGDLTERRQIVEFTVNHVYTISDTDVDFFNEAGVRITVNQEA